MPPLYASCSMHRVCCVYMADLRLTWGVHYLRDSKFSLTDRPCTQGHSMHRRSTLSRWRGIICISREAKCRKYDIMLPFFFLLLHVLFTIWLIYKATKSTLIKKKKIKNIVLKLFFHLKFFSTSFYDFPSQILWITLLNNYLLIDFNYVRLPESPQLRNFFWKHNIFF